MSFVKFYFFFFVGLLVIDLVNYFFLNQNLASLIGLLGFISLILSLIAIFKFRKLNLAITIKLFPILSTISAVIIMILVSIYAGDSQVLIDNGGTVKDAVLNTPYWILTIDKASSLIFMVYAICILLKLRNSK